jgi:1-phosphofructokinase family hexose kinase
LFICVSLNPGVDKRLTLTRLQHGRVNRATGVTMAAGGKAAHVAMVLRTLGADPLWLGFAGGHTGNSLVEGLQELSIRVRTVPTVTATRMNLEIVEEVGGVTEILEPGPPVTAAEIEKMRAAFESALKESEGEAIAILSGSLPGGVPADFYATLTELGHRRGCRIFLDASGEPLRLALKSHPDFVKPNRNEAEELSGKVLGNPRAAGEVLREILDQGARAAAISLGEAGLVSRSAHDTPALAAKAPALAVRSAVGSGDSTLAGFAFAAQSGLSPSESLRLAVACGAANCLADGPGRARLTDIERLRAEIHVEVLE